MVSACVRMSAMFGFDIDAIIYLRILEQERGYLHAPKPMRAPTEANFDRILGGVNGPCIESA